MRGPEEFLFQFHVRQRRYGAEEHRWRQDILIKSLELICTILEGMGYELYLKDGKGKVHRAMALVRYLLSGGDYRQFPGEE